MRAFRMHFFLLQLDIIYIGIVTVCSLQGRKNNEREREEIRAQDMKYAR